MTREVAKITIIKIIEEHYFPKTKDEWCANERVALAMGIEALEKQNGINHMVDEIERTDWYHIGENGKLVHGANSKEEGTEPLYVAEDILKICDKYRCEEVE